jgi:hypothetical protein
MGACAPDGLGVRARNAPCRSSQRRPRPSISYYCDSRGTPTSNSKRGHPRRGSWPLLGLSYATNRRQYNGVLSGSDGSTARFNSTQHSGAGRLAPPESRIHGRCLARRCLLKGETTMNFECLGPISPVKPADAANPGLRDRSRAHHTGEKPSKICSPRSRLSLLS